MENESMQHEVFSPNPNSPESTSSAPPQPYSNPSQYPQTSEMPYPNTFHPRIQLLATLNHVHLLQGNSHIIRNQE